MTDNRHHSGNNIVLRAVVRVACVPYETKQRVPAAAMNDARVLCLHMLHACHTTLSGTCLIAVRKFIARMLCGMWYGIYFGRVCASLSLAVALVCAHIKTR